MEKRRRCQRVEFFYHQGS